MFKKRFRLKTSEFKEVFNCGRTIKNPIFVLKTKKNNLPYSRVAVVVSKKIANKAVERNHYKRRFISALENIVDTFPVADYVFILNSGIKEIQYKDLINNLKETKI